MADYSRDYRISYSPDGRSCTIGFRCFDTPNTVCVHAREGELREDVEDVLLAARRLCLELHRLWSFTLAGSDVARINMQKTRIEVDSRTANLVETMILFNRLEPCFDFTVGPVSYFWKHAERIPDPNEISEALRHVGASKVRVVGNEVVKKDPLVQIDVGGAAKGYAADLVAGMLRSEGVDCADIDLGGNLFMVGSHPSGRPWRVAVRVPEDIDAERVILELVDESAVTSGSYERYVEIGGRRYQHIIDASTGWPLNSDIISATVVAKSSAQADLLATAACLAGSTGFSALAARHPKCRFVAIAEDSRILREGF